MSEVKSTKASQTHGCPQSPYDRPRVTEPERDSQELIKSECKRKDKLGKMEKAGKMQKMNRMGEDRKSRSKKEKTRDVLKKKMCKWEEERHKGDRKKKKKKERKEEKMESSLRTKMADKTLKGTLTSPCKSSSERGPKLSQGQIQSINLISEREGQSLQKTPTPSKHKHRERRERREKTLHRHQTATATPNISEIPSSPREAPHSRCSSPHASKHKVLEQGCSPLTPHVERPLPAVRQQTITSGKQRREGDLRRPLLPTPSPSTINSPNQTSTKPPINQYPSECRPETKPDPTLPSLSCRASAPHSVAGPINTEEAIEGKVTGQGGVLMAPYLQPAAVMGSVLELGDNPAASPPVLSWQGSPVSSEDEDEMDKGVICRPVLQPSPTHGLSPSHGETEKVEDMNEEACEAYCHNDLAKLNGQTCVKKGVAEEEDEEKVEDSNTDTSGSLLHRRLHLHQTGLADVFKSLASFLGSQKYTYRGGPFGRPPPSAPGMVKYSSSLALGPDIHCQEHQDPAPATSDPSTSSSTPTNQSQTHTISDTCPKLHPPSDLSEQQPVVESLRQKQEEVDNGRKEKREGRGADTHPGKTSPPLAASLSAELTLTTTHTSSLAGLLPGPTKHERVPSKAKGRDYTKRKRKQISIDVKREEVNIKRRKEDSSGICNHHKNGANEINDKDKEEKNNKKTTPVSSSLSVSSSDSSKQFEENIKERLAQEDHNQPGKDIQGQRENVHKGTTEQVALVAEKKEVSELETKLSSPARNTDTVTSSATPTTTTSTTNSFTPTPASKTPCPLAVNDPLRLKALSMGLSKELKIRLIKVESADRKTFITSQVEERRIPLSKISIENTASEVIGACK